MVGDLLFVAELMEAAEVIVLVATIVLTAPGAAVAAIVLAWPTTALIVEWLGSALRAEFLEEMLKYAALLTAQHAAADTCHAAANVVVVTPVVAAPMSVASKAN